MLEGYELHLVYTPGFLRGNTSSKLRRPFNVCFYVEYKTTVLQPGEIFV
jgi:hypothetical protein